MDFRLISLRALALGALIAASGCISPKTEVSPEVQAGQVTPYSVVNRTPSSEEELNDYEPLFQKMLKESDGSIVMQTNYLERILRIYYRTELSVREFGKNLDQILAKQKHNPEYFENPLKHPSYQRTLAYRPLRERLNEKIIYFYTRLFQEAKTGGEHSARARVLIEQIHSWIEGLKPADRLLINQIIVSLASVKTQFDQAAIEKAEYRMPAGIAGFHPKSAIWSGKSDLSADYEKMDKVILERAQEIARIPDQELEISTQLDFEDRAPAGISEKIKPGTGPFGNIYGLSLPPGNLVFTFDDGPLTKSTSRLLTYLTSHRDPINTNGVPASFFWQVRNLKTSPEMINKTKALGFTLNHHSWNHPMDFIKNEEAFDLQINQAYKYMVGAYGNQPALGGSNKFKFMRCPFGSCMDKSTNPVQIAKTAKVRKMIADLGLIHVHWCIDSHDWENTGNPNRTFELTVKQIQAVKRGVILIHDIHEASVDAAKMLFDWIGRQNQAGGHYRLLSVEKAVDELNQTVGK